MRFDVVTIFPELFPGPLAHGVLGRALRRERLRLVVHDLRRHADPPHYQVDDEPYGGGAGMVFKPEPMHAALSAVTADLAAGEIAPGPTVLLTPQGQRLDHALVTELASEQQLTLICGRYEGVDERIREHMVELEVSIGDFVVTGGEVPAMLLIEAVGRWQPDTLGDPDSAHHDSFVAGLLDFPQYTRPADFHGWCVPEVLRSGNHGAIAAWRRRAALRRTARRRPDLLAAADLTHADLQELARRDNKSGE